MDNEIYFNDAGLQILEHIADSISKELTIHNKCELTYLKDMLHKDYKYPKMFCSDEIIMDIVKENDWWSENSGDMVVISKTQPMVTVKMFVEITADIPKGVKLNDVAVNITVNEIREYTSPCTNKLINAKNIHYENRQDMFGFVK